MQLQLPSPTQKITLPLLEEKGIELFLKRDDLIHDVVSGNKWRKLKYNIQSVVECSLSLSKCETTGSKKTILTFGGAYSNHIVATAFACKEYGIKSIGVIRGEELQEQQQLAANSTLKFVMECGMHLHFVSREDYRRKNENDFINKLKNLFGDFYLIPEGGANDLGVKGCREILEEESVVELNRNHQSNYNFICCAAGTGTTLSGLFLSLRENEKLMGFPALKNGEFILEEIKNKVPQKYFEENKSRIELNCDYHFGGYAKINEALKNFVADFFTQTNIQLDYIYNGKMMFGLFDLIRKDHFPKGSRILVIHTGGVQGNTGFSE